MSYQPTIGLEIHVELKTATKMFCDSRNDTKEERPNVNICPVCMAHPGTLPVINREAVRHVLMLGAAIGGKFADYTEFDRKNYFYPDLPKGYQLSQYEFPLISGGNLNGIAITRVHLEEDTASSTHDEVTGETLIDYNRAGVPLMELVTEPVIHSAKEAGDFARELHLLLLYLGISDAEMQRGEMRVEANISISKEVELGRKVEIKNLNSFRAMERAVEYEVQRQTEILESGEQVIQETRGWDDVKQATFSQRVKEVAADYRYFPDPDLPSLRLSEIPEYSIDTISASMPVLPAERRRAYMARGVKKADAEQFTAYPMFGNFFDEVILGSTDVDFITRAANYVANDLVNIIRDIAAPDTYLKRDMPISADHFREIMNMISSDKLSSRAAKDLLALTIKQGRDPQELAKEHGLLMDTSTDKLEGVVSSVINTHESVVADYKKGKDAALQFLVGQGMRELKGAVDPAKLRNAILLKIGKRD